MNFKMMGRFLAQILSIEGIFMVPALIISLCCGDAMAVKGFVWAIAAIAVIAALLALSSRGAPSAFYAREGLVCVDRAQCPGLFALLDLPGDPQLCGCFF